MILNRSTVVWVVYTLIDDGSGSLGRERNIYQGSGRQSRIRREVGWGGGKIIALPLPPTPTVHCSSKSNMAGRINDRELMLARPYKTPALYSFLGAVMMLTPCFKHSIKKYDFCCVFYYFVPHVFLSNFLISFSNLTFELFNGNTVQDRP